MTSLAGRWPLADHDGLRAQLESAWHEPTRGYHDARHLAEVLDRLDELAAAGTGFDRREVVLAAWFHDAVYDGRPDAEERSARWAERALADAGCDPAEVARLVRLTAQHRVAPGDRNGAALCDADLAVLASPARRYAAYVADVRREWPHLSARDFAAGRLVVLQGLLDQERLFETRHGRAQWEPVARANLDAEMVSLREVVGQVGPSGGAARPPAGGSPAPGS